MLKTIIRKSLANFNVDVKRYENSEPAIVKRCLQSYHIDLVLDVGANSGQYAKWLRKLGYTGAIISFEPGTDVYNLLVTNSSRDDLWYIAPRCAIGSENKMQKFNISAASASSSLLDTTSFLTNFEPKTAYISEESVEIKKLDDLLGNVISEKYNSIFLKMDVQGYENEVMIGAQNLLRTKISVIHTELSTVPLYHDQKLINDVLIKLDGYQFDLFSLYPELIDPQTKRTLQMNGIFTKRN